MVIFAPWLSRDIRISPFGLVVTIGVFMSQPAAGYMQYAATYNINSCTSCHYSPVGGGPRTLPGKLFGAHNFPIHPSRLQEIFSADFRLVYYRPKSVETSKGGLGLMSGSVAAHAQLDVENRFLLVLDHNVAGFSAAPLRDTYLLYRLHGENDLNQKMLLAGRFRLPFGYITDEHRTYTRLMSNTRWFDLQTGLMFSHDLTDQFHYDVALFNGTMSTTTLNSGQADRWGLNINSRWTPGAVTLGSSVLYKSAPRGGSAQDAWSVYSLFSFARWSRNSIPANFILEYTQAKGFNRGLEGFVGGQAYPDAVADSAATGWLVTFEWIFSRRFILLYKFDSLTPDRNFPGDYYDRHGLGLRWTLGPNVLLQARSEWARATPKSERDAPSPANQDAIFGIVQVAL